MEGEMSHLGVNLIAMAVFMVVGWLVSLRIRNVSLVDSMWGIGFILIAATTYFQTDGFTGRRLLLLTLVSLWGVRLAVHLTWRNWGAGEDPRYAKWRADSEGRFWYISLFKVFLLQALVLWLIALNVQMGMTAFSPDRLTWFDWVGTFVWGLGFTLEVVADWQLARFKSSSANNGRIMDKGLWAYSRHPNYFGEVMIWWGIFVITLSQPAHLWTVVSPVLITLVVLKMTGIPMTEAHTAQRRPGYECYRKRTSAFVPWRPKKGMACEHTE